MGLLLPPWSQLTSQQDKYAIIISLEMENEKQLFCDWYLDYN